MIKKQKIAGNFGLILIVFLPLLFSCELYKHPKNDPYRPTVIKVIVADRVQEFKDSLIATGVDSIFVLSKECSGCYHVPYAQSKKEYKKGIDCTSFSYALPSYIFWSEKGSYFVKRIDQFDDYVAIERWKHQQLPLYDYFLRNQKSIENEQITYVLYDTLLVSIRYNTRIKDTIIKETNVEYYHPTPHSVTIEKPLSNQFSLDFFIQQNSFKTSLSEDYFTPIATEEFENEIHARNKGYALTDSVVVGNNSVNYTLNQSMKVYQLKQMIESELLEIELRQLWRPQPFE